MSLSLWGALQNRNTKNLCQPLVPPQPGCPIGPCLLPQRDPPLGATARGDVAGMDPLHPFKYGSAAVLEGKGIVTKLYSVVLIETDSTQDPNEQEKASHKGKA